MFALAFRFLSLSLAAGILDDRMERTTRSFGLIRRDALGSPRSPHFCQLHHATARFVSPFVYTCFIDQTYSNFIDVFIY